MLRRVFHGWVPQNETKSETLEWARLQRYPPETRKDCRKYYGQDCKPVKRTVEMVVRDG